MSHTASENGIHVRTRCTDGTLDWSNFVSVAEDDARAFLLTERRSALVVPKRAFEDVASYRNFVAFAAGRIEHARASDPMGSPTPSS